MKSLEINILENENLVLDVLKDFEKKHFITFSNKNNSIAFDGARMSDLEYEEMLSTARKTKKYTVEEARSYLNI